MRTPVCRCGGRAELRRQDTMGRRVRVVWQCVGRCGKRLASAPVLGHDVNPLDLPRFERRKKAQPNSRKRDYQKFLHSPAWARIRRRVMDRARGLCEMRLWGCTGRATEVHHVDYEAGLEGLDADGQVDLRKFKASCRGCNLLEREQRITRHVLGPAEEALVASLRGAGTR